MKQHALPVLTPVSAELIPQDDVATQQARVALQEFNIAMAANDTEALKDCFFGEQAFWKDQLALTWYLRTLISPAKIVPALLETTKQRDITGEFEMDGEAQFAQVGPHLVNWLHLHNRD
jgi:hypothetical protein